MLGVYFSKNIAALDLPDSVRRDAPQLVEAYFEYLDTSGKMPGAAGWTESMPEAIAYYEEHLRSDGSVKGETVRHTQPKSGATIRAPAAAEKSSKSAV